MKSNLPSDRSSRHLPARMGRLWSWRWVVLAAVLLAAVTLGDGLTPAAQAQDERGTVAAPTLTSDTSGEISVSWETPSPTPSDYRLDWAKTGANYRSYSTAEGHLYPGGSDTQATITGLDVGADYKVRIRARYNDGDYADDPWSGPWTDDVTVTVTGTPPGEITGIAVTRAEADSLLIAWLTPSPAPNDYRVDWAKSAEEYTSWTVEEGHSYPEGTETTVTIEGLDPGTEYKVRMRARYSGNSPWSGPWSSDVLMVTEEAATEEVVTEEEVTEEVVTEEEVTEEVVTEEEVTEEVVTEEEVTEEVVTEEEVTEEVVTEEVIEEEVTEEEVTEEQTTEEVTTEEPLLPPGIVFIDTEPLVSSEQSSEDPVLVSNLDQASAENNEVPFVGNQPSAIPVTDSHIAVQFTTGNLPGGYTISGVQVFVGTSAGSAGEEGNFKAEVTRNAGGRPGTPVSGGTLGPATFSDAEMTGELALDALAPILLNPDTTYWLVFDMDDMPENNRIRIDATLSDDEDPVTHDVQQLVRPQVGQGALEADLDKDASNVRRPDEHRDGCLGNHPRVRRHQATALPTQADSRDIQCHRGVGGQSLLQQAQLTGGRGCRRDAVHPVQVIFERPTTQR